MADSDSIDDTEGLRERALHLAAEVAETDDNNVPVLLLRLKGKSFNFLKYPQPAPGNASRDLSQSVRLRITVEFKSYRGISASRK